MTKIDYLRFFPNEQIDYFRVGVLKNINKTFEFPEESLTKKVLKDVLYNVPISNGTKYNEEKIK